MPTQKLLKLKGLEMRYKIKQDHLSTYLELCPAITFFNGISPDAEVFSCIYEGDVDGRQKLFSERQASPNDRDPNGFTLLHVSPFDFGRLNYLICSRLIQFTALLGSMECC